MADINLLYQTPIENVLPIFSLSMERMLLCWSFKTLELLVIIFWTSFWRFYRVLGYFKSLMLTWLNRHCFLYVLVCLLALHLTSLSLSLCCRCLCGQFFLSDLSLSDLKVHLLDIIHSSFTLFLFSRSKIILDIIPLFVVVVFTILSF